MTSQESAASHPEPVRRFVPVAVAKPALATALGIDGGAIFQILAVENLGLSPAAIGTAFGLGLLSIPLQLWAGRIPLRLARRNLQIFFVLAATQSALLAWLLAVGATNGLAATALVVTVTAEIAISVLFVTAWQPLLSTRSTIRDRQRVNSGWTALGRGLVAGMLLVFAAADVPGRVVLLVALAFVSVGVAINLGRIPLTNANPPAATPRTSIRRLRPPTPALRWILASFIAINLGALPLWLVYLSQTMWPTVNLGVIGAIQAAAVVVALLTWRTTERGLGRRAVVGVLLTLSGSLALLGVGQVAESSAEYITVVAVTVVMAFGMMYASLALLEMAHRLVRNQEEVVPMFTLIDVVDSSSLQLGLFVGGLLITWSLEATAWSPYVAFVVAASILAVAAVVRTVKIVGPHS